MTTHRPTDPHVEHEESDTNIEQFFDIQRLKLGLDKFRLWISLASETEKRAPLRSME